MNERLHNDGDYTIFKVEVQLQYDKPNDNLAG
jgi:hypothetical protein